MKTLRTETRNGVGSIILTRAAEYNTITPELRDELSGAIDRVDADRGNFERVGPRLLQSRRQSI
jgi:enoyl-CoA hydratase/carnithine racemase